MHYDPMMLGPYCISKALRLKRAAWQKHYEAKGCSAEKAFNLAAKKWDSSPFPALAGTDLKEGK